MPPRKTPSSARDGQDVSNLRHLLTAGGLVAGTLGTLLLGAALQVDPQSVADEPAAVITESSLPGSHAVGGEFRGSPPVASAPLRTPEPLPAPPKVPSKTPPATPPSRGAAPAPADRADDSRRMLSGGDEWTLQFMVACNAESTARLRRAVTDDPRLYLLPVSIEGRSCQRVCWNTYRTRDLAVADTDIPAALRQVNAEPLARKVTDLTR